MLASAAIAPGAITAAPSLAFVPVTFSPPAPVVAGVQYAIVAYTGAADQYQWGAADGNPYAGGEAFQTDASPPDHVGVAHRGLPPAARSEQQIA